MTWDRSISTGRPPAEGEPSPEWHTKPQPSLEDAIARFKAALPGWWYSVCECQVSCDATVAPTSESPDIALVAHGNSFDSGFSVDLYQPSTLAEALTMAMEAALEAKAACPPPPVQQTSDLLPG